MKYSKSEKAFNLLNVIAMFIIGIITVYPFYYVFIYSISDPTKASRAIYLIPAGFSFQNYIEIFTRQNISQAIIISTARTIVGTILTVICSAMFAYGISKERLPFRKLMYRLVIMTMYLSPGLIPWYLTMRTLGMKNNFLLYVLPGAVGAFFVILIKTYYEQLPAAIEESAMVDGAGYFRIFWSIIFRLSAPVLATVAIFSAVGQWNSWTDNLYLCSSPKLMTLQLLLYNFLSEHSASTIVDSSSLEALSKVKVTPTSIRMTITIIVIFPVLAVYPFLQKYFLKGLLVGSVKG